MKRVFLVLAGVAGLLLAALVYERVFVEVTLGPAAIAAMLALATAVAILLVLARLYDTRHRETINNLTLAVVSVLVSYLAIDLIAGYVLIRPLSPPLVADQYRHHRMVPNSLSSFHQKDFDYVQRVNNFGMRGPDVTAAKPAGTYRILMLGDSFTMGKGVEDQQTFSVLLGKALAARVAACGGPTIEVLNGGVDSYAPILSYLELTRDLGALAPDMIVLNLDVSDLVQEAAYRQIAVYGADGEILGVPQAERAASLTERIREWTQRHMFITRALLYYLLERADYREFGVRQVVEQANMAVAAHTLAEDTESRDEQWRNIFDSLGRIQKYADAHGSRFLLSVYPWGHQVSDREWVPGRYAFMPEGTHPSDKSRETVLAMSAANGIELIDLFPAFRAYKGSAPLYFANDMHWTTTGHEVAAAGLEAHLASSYLYNWCQ